MALTLDNIKARIGAERVRQYLDDDGDGIEDEVAVREVLDEARSYVAGQLLLSFPSEAQIDKLRDDPRIIGAEADIAIGLMGERRPEYLNSEGKGPFHQRFARGRETLKNLAKALERSPKEAEAGRNLRVGGSLTTSTPTFQFATSRGNRRGPGGF